MNKILFIKSAETYKEELFSGIRNKECEVEILEKENSYLTKHKQANLVIIDSPINQNLHLCKRFREEGIEIPIIAFSKADSIEERVKALLQGADDIVEEGINPEEFKAKIFSILRRPAVFYVQRVSLLDLEINLTLRSVIRAGKHIHLRRKEFDLLAFLIRNKGKVLTRDKILENIWEDEDTFTNTIDVHIRNLRKKVDEPFEVKLIKTIHGIGYKVE